MRLVVVLSCMGLFVGTAMAQSDAPSRVDDYQPLVFSKRSVLLTVPLAGEVRLRYLVRQLDLNPDQAKSVAGVWETIYDAPPDIDPGVLRRLNVLRRELKDAKNRMDSTRALNITDEMTELNMQISQENEFLESVSKVLTDEQLILLSDARGRMKRVPSGGIRPVDLFQAFWRLNPTDAEMVKGVEAKEILRETLRRGGARLAAERRIKLASDYARRLAEALSAEKRAVFVRRVECLRTDQIPGIQKYDDQIFKNRRSGNK